MAAYRCPGGKAPTALVAEDTWDRETQFDGLDKEDKDHMMGKHCHDTDHGLEWEEGH